MACLSAAYQAARGLNAGSWQAAVGLCSQAGEQLIGFTKLCFYGASFSMLEADMSVLSLLSIPHSAPSRIRREKIVFVSTIIYNTDISF